MTACALPPVNTPFLAYRYPLRLLQSVAKREHREANSRDRAMPWPGIRRRADAVLRDAQALPPLMKTSARTRQAAQDKTPE